MHNIQIPSKYPCPKFSIGDVVAYKIDPWPPKVGEITGLLWCEDCHRWAYQVTEFGQVNTDDHDCPSEDDIMAIADLVTAWQDAQRSVSTASAIA